MLTLPTLLLLSTLTQAPVPPAPPVDAAPPASTNASESAKAESAKVEAAELNRIHQALGTSARALQDCTGIRAALSDTERVLDANPESAMGLVLLSNAIDLEQAICVAPKGSRLVASSEEAMNRAKKLASEIKYQTIEWRGTLLKRNADRRMKRAADSFDRGDLLDVRRQLSWVRYAGTESGIQLVDPDAFKGLWGKLIAAESARPNIPPGQTTEPQGVVTRLEWAAINGDVTALKGQLIAPTIVMRDCEDYKADPTLFPMCIIDKLIPEKPTIKTCLPSGRDLACEVGGDSDPSKVVFRKAGKVWKIVANQSGEAPL